MQPNGHLNTESSESFDIGDNLCKSNAVPTSEIIAAMTKEMQAELASLRRFLQDELEATVERRRVELQSNIDKVRR